MPEGAIDQARAIFQKHLLFPSLNLVCRLTVEGRRHLPRRGAFVLVANHASHLDAIALTAALPHRIRERLRICAAADYFYRNPVSGHFVEFALNTIPFVRGAGASASLRAAKEILRQGHPVLIFPEGTRTPDGRMARFKKGAGILALETAVAVVPAGLIGTYEAWPKARKLPRPNSALGVRFGRPLRPRPDDTPEALVARAEASVRQLAGAPPGEPDFVVGLRY